MRDLVEAATERTSPTRFAAPAFPPCEPARLDPRSGRLTGRRLLWYHHEGWSDGSSRWAQDSGRKVGNGWSFPQVFCG